MITQVDKEIPTPEIARPRVPHDFLFAIGGMIGENYLINYIETYDIRADRWIKVSCTQLYLYCALLNNACKKNPFFSFCLFLPFNWFPLFVHLSLVTSMSTFFAYFFSHEFISIAVKPFLREVTKK
jgi:hypothetical protein